MTGPRPYLRPWPVTWWWNRAAYRRYMLRELTCIPIAAWIGEMIVGLDRLLHGPTAWDHFLAALAAPAGLVFQGMILVAAMYHSITWFSLAPRTMALRVRGHRVASGTIAAVHYVLWVIVTAGILVLAGW